MWLDEIEEASDSPIIELLIQRKRMARVLRELAELAKWAKKAREVYEIVGLNKVEMTAWIELFNALNNMSDDAKELLR